MTDLVFLEPNKIDSEPFTTSDIIAGHADINYRSVQRTIENQIERLERFGVMRFEITLPEKGSKGGRPKKVYKLNEQQATLLITFLKNNDKVAEFKVELVRQFFAMRSELNRRHIERAQLKPIRREMTDVIQQVTDSKWAYKLYTDLSYKLAVGKIAAKLREERGAPKNAVAADYMTANEIHDVAELQYRIAVLLEMGMDYTTVKDTLANRLLLNAS